jgi:hypothetical protein
MEMAVVVAALVDGVGEQMVEHCSIQFVQQKQQSAVHLNHRLVECSAMVRSASVLCTSYDILHKHDDNSVPTEA